MEKQLLIIEFDEEMTKEYNAINEIEEITKKVGLKFSYTELEYK